MAILAETRRRIKDRELGNSHFGKIKEHKNLRRSHLGCDRKFWIGFMPTAASGGTTEQCVAQTHHKAIATTGRTADSGQTTDTSGNAGPLNLASLGPPEHQLPAQHSCALNLKRLPCCELAPERRECCQLAQERKPPHYKAYRLLRPARLQKMFRGSFLLHLAYCKRQSRETEKTTQEDHISS